MRTHTTLLLGCLSLHASLSLGQISEEHYRIFSVESGTEVTLDVVVEDMKEHDVLFVGEEHNDSVGHYLESRLLELLHQSFNNGVTLSLEMFDRDVQPVMNEYLNGYIRERNFTKDARAWSNYRDYRPMVEFAKANKLDVICANAPSRYTNLAGRKGQHVLTLLPEGARGFFAPLPYDTATSAYHEKLLAMSGHGASPISDTAAVKAPPMPMGAFNLVTAQSLWDATMAYSIAEYLKKKKQQKVMQVNGRFHSDEGFAVVAQLKKYRPKTRMLVVSIGPDDSFPNIDWNAYSHLGDYIIITDPGVPKTFEE